MQRDHLQPGRQLPVEQGPSLLQIGQGPGQLQPEKFSQALGPQWQSRPEGDLGGGIKSLGKGQGPTDPAKGPEKDLQNFQMAQQAGFGPAGIDKAIAHRRPNLAGVIGPRPCTTANVLNNSGPGALFVAIQGLTPATGSGVRGMIGRGRPLAINHRLDLLKIAEPALGAAMDPAVGGVNLGQGLIVLLDQKAALHPGIEMLPGQGLVGPTAAQI